MNRRRFLKRAAGAFAGVAAAAAGLPAMIGGPTFHWGGIVYGPGDVPALLDNGCVLSRKGASSLGLDDVNDGIINVTKEETAFLSRAFAQAFDPLLDMARKEAKKRGIDPMTSLIYDLDFSDP